MEKPRELTFRFRVGKATDSSTRHIRLWYDVTNAAQSTLCRELREEINSVNSLIAADLKELRRQLQSPLNLQVAFDHSHSAGTQIPAWGEILDEVLEHHADGVRVLVRLASGNPEIEAASPPKTSMPSHLVALQFGRNFDITPATPACDLCLLLPTTLVALRSILLDIARDIFLFHTLTSLAIGAGQYKFTLPIETLRQHSVEKLEFALRENCLFYGISIAELVKNGTRYVSLSGCLRSNILAPPAPPSDAIRLYKQFFDEQFPRVEAHTKVTGTLVDNSADILAESLLSLSKVGGHVSKRRMTIQIQRALRSGCKELLFCYVRRIPPTQLFRAASGLLGRRCKAGGHAVVAGRHFALAVALSPWIQVIRIYRRPSVTR